ncbi:MAG: hypothetical protein HOP96_06245, partial [Sphingomonas sp.]|nr:hypothetical protein [Sphingomonas sp.]
QVQGSQDNRVNLVVTAILADEDQTFDNTPYNADGTNGVEAGESKVTITSVVINDYSDASGGGTLGASYTFTLGQPDPAGAAAAGFDVTFVNGSVVIEGLKQNDQYEINTGSNFSAVVIESPGGPNNWLSTLDPHPEAGNQIANANDLDLGIISIGATGAGTPIVQTFPIIAVDGDGDQVSGSITTTINPVVAAAALPLAKVAPTADLAVVNDGLITDTDHTLKSMNAANNNAVLLGAVAAAGLVGSPAAAHDAVVDSSHLSIADFGVQGGAELAMPAMSIDRGEAVRSALLDGGREGAVDQALATQASGGHGNDMVAAAHGLAGQPQVEHSAPTELLQPMDMQAQAATQGFAPVADAVVMPSAEMLSLIADARSAVDGDGHGRDLGNVLSDALAGGHHGPSIDAIIEAVTGEARDNNLAVRSVQDAGANHAGAGADAGASHADAAVSGWDSAAFAGFTHAQAYSMEALAAHPDAAPAAHAG